MLQKEAEHGFYCNCLVASQQHKETQSIFVQELEHTVKCIWHYIGRFTLPPENRF